MPLSDYALNLAADHLAGRTIQVRLHTGEPGNAGTANAISGATADVAASGWSNAASGDVSNVAAIDFGVLSTTASNDVSHYSIWDGTNFMGSESLASTVTVAANETFSINAGTLQIMGSTS